MGSAFGFIGIVFVIINLVKYSNEADLSRFNIGTLFFLIGLALVYGISGLILALAWRDILKHLKINVNIHWAIQTYGLSQLAKYVPGNIFHLAGRQAIGLGDGLPALPLAKSIFWEFPLISVAGIFFTPLALPFFTEKITESSAIIIFFILILACTYVAYKWFSFWVGRAINMYTVFLSLSGIIFVAIVYLVVPSGSVNTSTVAGICGAYVVAWLAGLLIPGAPAGAGVRELVLFGILQSVVSKTDLLSAIIFGRIVTVIGDVVFYLLAVFLRGKTVSNKEIAISFNKDKPLK